MYPLSEVLPPLGSIEIKLKLYLFAHTVDVAVAFILCIEFAKKLNGLIYIAIVTKSVPPFTS